MPTTDQLIAILITAVLIEAVVDSVKRIIKVTKDGRRAVEWEYLVAMAVGVLVAVVWNIDFFTTLIGEPSDPSYTQVGEVLTGIVLGRGSNYFYGLIKRIGVISSGEPPTDREEKSEA